MDNSQTKTCPRCKQEKPLSNFSRNIRMKDGLSSYCKRCCNENAKEYISKIIHGGIKKITRPIKRCPFCKQDKPISEFYETNRSVDGHTGYCKDCSNAKTKELSLKAYRTEDGKKKILARIKRYQQSEKGKKWKLNYQRSEKGRAESKRLHIKLRDSGYFRYGMGALRNLKNSAKKRGLHFTLTKSSLSDWWNSTEDKCYYCGIIVNDFISIRNFLLNYNGNNREILIIKNMFFKGNRKNMMWMTIDRKDNARGYEIDNMEKCCLFCNVIKGPFLNSDEMLLVAKGFIGRLRKSIEEEINKKGSA